MEKNASMAFVKRVGIVLFLGLIIFAQVLPMLESVATDIRHVTIVVVIVGDKFVLTKGTVNVR